MTRQPRVYPPGDRPDVEVLVDGIWHPGELRMWKPEGEDGWVGQVQWRPAGTGSRRIDDFAADLVRPVEDASQPGVDPAP